MSRVSGVTRPTQINQDGLSYAALKYCSAMLAKILKAPKQMSDSLTMRACLLIVAAQLSEAVDMTEDERGSFATAMSMALMKARHSQAGQLKVSQEEILNDPELRKFKDLYQLQTFGGF
jgi:hypothetical protein